MQSENLPKSRREAKQLGAKHYHTGTPCKKGHMAAKHVHTGCVECKKMFDSAYLELPGRREAAILRARAHYRNNREHHLARGKERRAELGELRREWQRAWYAANKDRIREKLKAKRDDAKRAKERAYRSMKIASDPIYAVATRMRSYIANSLAIFGKTGASRPRAKAILGCSFEEFKVHIEKQFLRGMSWENRSLWHIDHIVPLASASNKDEILSLFHHSNLRPMWAKENRAKSHKITHLI